VLGLVKDESASLDGCEAPVFGKVRVISQLKGAYVTWIA
jgi:hypothetical protein